MSNYSTDEMMTVAAARRLASTDVTFVGIGLPSKAANLARLTHAPEITLIYESGPIGARPSVLPLSIGDGELAETAGTVVSTGEIFRYWLQGGRIDVGFLGAAQVDRYGNINTTVIGDYHKPKVRLPGAGGAPEIAGSAKKCSSSSSRASAPSSTNWPSSPRSATATAATIASGSACPGRGPSPSSPTSASWSRRRAARSSW